MTDSITNDRAIRTAAAALDGLSRQQELVGQNLANVDTPGYRAQSADFQTALRRALHEEARPGLKAAALEVTQPGHIAAQDQPDGIQLSLRQGGSLRADGNNVDIDVELSQMAETGIQYHAMTQLVSKKLILLKNLVSGR
jgi:flagellar basal-body rod protein FlgB